MTDSIVEQTERPRPVTFLITDLDQGGAEQALVELVTRLDRTQWAPSVLCLSKKGVLVERLRQADIPFKALGAKSLRDLPRVFLQLRRKLKELNPEILCTYLYHANILGRIAAWTLRSRPRVFCGIRVAEKRSKWRLRIDRVTDWMVTGHLCVSQDVARFSEEVGKLPAKKLHVVPNGVDITRFENADLLNWQEIGLAPSAKVLLYAGRLNPQKGLDDLLTAIIPLLKRDSDLHLVLAGEGSLRQRIEQRIAMEQLEQKILLLGHRNDIPKLMRGATVLVHASHWEGAPNVVLEAMAARLPVVCTATEGTGELVPQIDLGRVVPIGATSEFRAAVKELLNDEELRRKTANSAYLHVKQEFTWTKSVSNWEEVVLSS
ncbi:N-acetylgalactosamine-N,N'-diacetylbacillosaminyl-diphospho-undecaprenol 4-alpha-N-acetylgalactosaminyltransferase [Polystyrenella longa]|uniref:N-acetylgalactosamine-N, N'-diacetylbacillosaminyl-diphospho-undecaprenol 4-alpha-N-acetylgalactosaminyltransferase n=1 Tax=Polystyrenella longa TaxID=2528007 RepID=A0A518CNP2_9PLAN|nr:glycosyltransferase [Polystyrenella longa]QDU80851.1 N-acetylgalactosamine-N,N'-diacetylbacillosaminyl-diphospho-undecaprenol 4-alpha-N-acetylgalactosaminyltransferase [Polystyrenella longa]